MSYTALYRKWRPRKFSEVKGQEAIVRTLVNQIKSGKIGHAYLFCGSRGTGKTTVAKIFARAINCEQPVDGEPCGKCDICQSIGNGASMNLLEIDAASNNGVDFIRQIEEEISYPPTEGRYRVYIIDEVHMLSVQAFNAFLKTLEEPPAYVVFILATTEPHKIPATILSRCQQYDFRRIGTNTIIERLNELCAGEGIQIEDRALAYIARKADGGLRDAISLLDRAEVAAEGEMLTYDGVLRSIGAVDNDIFSKYLRLTINRDAGGIISLIDEIIMSGREISQFAKDFSWYLRNVLLVKVSGGVEGMIDASDEDMQALREEAANISEDEIARLIRIYSSCYNEMRQAVSKRVLFEIAAIRSISAEAPAAQTAPQMAVSPAAQTAPQAAVFANESATPQAVMPVKEVAVEKKTATPQEEAFAEKTATPQAEDLKTNPENFETYLEKSEKNLEIEKNIAPGNLAGLISQATEKMGGIFAIILREATFADEDGALAVYFKDDYACSQADTLGVAGEIKQAYKSLGKDIRVVLKIGEATAQNQVATVNASDSNSKGNNASGNADSNSKGAGAGGSEGNSAESVTDANADAMAAVKDIFGGIQIEEE